MMSQEETLFSLPDPEYTDDLSQSVYKQIDIKTAGKLIIDHHYLGSISATKFAFGMYLSQVLAGVMMFGPIPGPNARGICGDEHQAKVLELTRLFIHEWAGRNAESKFLGAAFRLLTPLALKKGGLILLSYADTAAGHVGTIYQATNWLYTGESTSTRYVLPDGSLSHGRTVSSHGSTVGLQRVPTSIKHRYVYFLGDRTQRKALRQALRWQTQPYPKL
jgi:hypothetical protein